MFVKSQAGKDREWLWGAALFALTCLVYLPVLHAGFIWDDSYMVTDNHTIQSRDGFLAIWTHRPKELPLIMSFIWAQYQIWGMNPLGYHIVNVVTHGIGAILFWRLLRRLKLPGSWLAALVFAVHPVCVASAGWISEQKNTWSMVFYLLSLIAFLRFDESGKRKWFFLSIASYALAALTKGSVVVLPAVLLLMLWWRNGKLRARDFLRVTPHVLITLGAGWFTYWVQQNVALAGTAMQQENIVGRVALAGWAIWFYWWKAWLPVNICVIYPQWHATGSLLEFIPDALWLAALVVCWNFRKSWGRHVLFALIYVAIAVSPVLGFFNMYFLIFSRVADHWNYLALLGSVALAICGGVFLCERAAAKFHWPKFLGPAVAGALVIFLGISTCLRAEVYTTEEKIWRDTVTRNPNAWMAYNNLGNALGAQGRRDEAIEVYRAGIKIKPDFSDAHSNLGNALVGKKQLDEAVEHFRKAIEVQPNMPNFHFNLGIALFDQKKFDQAAAEYEAALKLRPGFADCRVNLANLFNKQDKYNQALEQALIALQIKPNSSEAHYNAGTAFAGLNRLAEATVHFESALKLRPDMQGVRYDLGVAYAMQNRLAEAEREFREFIRAHPDDAAGHGSLGNTLATAKKFDEAIAEYQTALRLAPDDPQARNNLGNVFFEQGKFAEAIEQYAAAIQRRGANADTHINFGVALARLGKRTEALAQFNEALRLKPGDAHIQKQIEALSAAK